MRALQKTNHEQCTCEGRKTVSIGVGSVCVLGETWLELLADRFLLLRCYCCVNETFPFGLVRPRKFSGACLFSFLNKGRFSTLSPQSAGVFLKIGCESEKFRARVVEDYREHERTCEHFIQQELRGNISKI